MLTERIRAPGAHHPRATGAKGALWLGPYKIVQDLVRAQDLWVVEAEDLRSARVVLQLLPLPNATSDAERAASQRTLTLMGHPDLELCAHGCAVGIDGSRFLFWAFPWRLPDPLRGLQSLARCNSQTVCLEAAVVVAQRLVVSHMLKLPEPHLRAEALFMGAHGRPVWLGAPVWLEDQSTPNMQDDVFRLGRALAQMSEGQPWGALLQPAIERFCGPQPPSAYEALAQLEALQGADISERSTEEIIVPEALGALVHTPPWASALSIQELQGLLALLMQNLEARQLNFEFKDRALHIHAPGQAQTTPLRLDLLADKAAKMPRQAWPPLVDRALKALLDPPAPSDFEESTTKLDLSIPRQRPARLALWLLAVGLMLAALLIELP